MSTAEELDRLARERAYHDDRFAHEKPRSSLINGLTGGFLFDALDAVYAIAKTRCPGNRVLDYGCSQGEGSLILRRYGASSVEGIDLSSVAVEQARQEAARQGVSGVHFQVMNAEVLEFPDRSFDFVFGVAILHHLDLDRASREIARVLTDSGTAVFLEPLGHNPFINAVRRLTPSARTPDEHPLRALDFQPLRAHFGTVAATYLNLSTLFTAPLTPLPGAKRVRRVLSKADRVLFRQFPTLTRYAWNVILDMKAPKRTA